MITGTAGKVGEVKNGWTLLPKNEHYFGAEYAIRTAVAYKAIYANDPAEAYYTMGFADAEGNVLDGRNRYAITFPINALPPVDYFWSLTIYDSKTQLLVENKLKRYSIGDRTAGLQAASDGSLTIHLGSAPPEEGESNWLPGPAGEFNVVLRLYGPRASILDGSWTPPGIRKTDR